MVSKVTDSEPDLAKRSAKPTPGILESDEQKLVNACRNGAPDAQRELYQRHSEQIYRLVFRLVGPEHADDVTQQVFVRVLQTIGQFRGRSALSTWLYRLATNEALQFLRKNNRHSTPTIAVDPVDHRASDGSRMEDRELLEQALSDLDPSLRAIFLLRELEQLSYHDIAHALDIAEGTVASRLNRARRLLKDWITARQRF